MADRGASTSRDYLLVAEQRYDEARYLHDGGRLPGAIYLAGLAVECVLKALILSTPRTPEDRGKLSKSIKGGKNGHNLRWLRDKYAEMVGTRITESIDLDLAVFEGWTVDLRYVSKVPDPDLVRDIFPALERIFRWARKEALDESDS